MIKLYEFALAKGDPTTPIDSRKVATATGLKETATKTIIKTLAQANFLKRIDDHFVQLTKRGCEFVLANK